MRRTLGGYFLLVTGFLACPCHLPLTLPLILGLLSGTAIGAFLAAHTGVLVGFSTAYFLGALAWGLWLVNRRAPAGQPACDLPDRPARASSSPIAAEPESSATPVGRRDCCQP
jgi:mercuric ion transport protein